MLKKGIKGRFRKKEKRRGRMTERKERRKENEREIK